MLRRAAEHLTPVTLELGGKSPCIVDSTAKIDLAARRIVFGKFLNCGQTCVAPDYIYCEASIQDKLVEAIQKEIKGQFGEHPLDNPDYGHIVNQRHFDRLLGLLEAAGEQHIAAGGERRPEELRIAPTVLRDMTFEDAVMGEEIFGPILPIVTWEKLDEAIEQIEAMPHPLALYCFTENKSSRKKVLERCHFGGGCMNDVVIHLAGSAMPFGGVGESGMGGYHGKAGFDEFTHYRSIVDKKTWMDLPMRYQPYNERKKKLIRLFLK